MGKKVLIVEDDEALMILESILLTSNGYSVSGAKSGKTALEAIATNRPDLVLLDARLPELNGFSVCSQIKSDPQTCHIPVVFLTGMNSAEDVRRGKDAGADHYITKPFKSKQVMHVIDNLLHSKAEVSNVKEDNLGKASCLC